MSRYPVSAVRPETDPFCKNRRWERTGGACGVNERDHTAHIRQALKPHLETEPHAAALRFKRVGGTFSADDLLLKLRARLGQVQAINKARPNTHEVSDLN